MKILVEKFNKHWSFTDIYIGKVCKVDCIHPKDNKFIMLYWIKMDFILFYEFQTMQFWLYSDTLKAMYHKASGMKIVWII